MQLLQNCLRCMHRRCIYLYYLTLKVDLASPPNKLHISIAREEQQACTSTKSMPPLPAFIYCFNSCMHSH